MKNDEVPQENIQTLGGARKAIYATDEQGRYTQVASSGWDVEQTVTQIAVEEFQRQAEQALADARAGKLAPLAFHMYANRMDLDTLSQSTGIAKWRVRRHLKPRVFAKLKPALLDRYADALGLDSHVLSAIPELVHDHD